MSAARVDPGRLAQRVWAGERATDRALRLALAPAAAVYGAVSSLRNHLYDAGWMQVQRVPAEVVSIGNLTVGGTGKTPTALWLASRLQERGRRVGIVARGYGKTRPGVVVVGEQGRPLVDPAEGGDEAVLLARRFAGPVVTGERRAEAAALACARFDLDTIVLDDGFQHRALARDADLVLVDAAASGRLLPAGPLREAAAALSRARALLVLDASVPPPAAAPLFRGRLRPTALVRIRDNQWQDEALATLAGRTVVAVAGVARPERFLATLAELGASVRRLLRYPDHHAYDAADAAVIAAAAAGEPLVTTEKDLVKLARFPALADLTAVRVVLTLDDEAALLACLVGGGRRQVELRAD